MVSELNDAATVFTGRDNITGEDIGMLGRGAAVIGAISPVSGGQIRAGAKASKVVIGETMDRVIPYAKSIGASWYNARGKNPANWMRNNEAWLRRQMREGKEIIDIGVDPARKNRSEFYKRETEMLEKSNYPVTRP